MPFLISPHCVSNITRANEFQREIKPLKLGSNDLALALSYESRWSLTPAHDRRARFMASLYNSYCIEHSQHHLLLSEDQQECIEGLLDQSLTEFRFRRTVSVWYRYYLAWSLLLDQVFWMAQRSISDKYIYTATLQSEWYCLRTGSVREAMSMIEIEPFFTLAPIRWYLSPRWHD